MRAIFRNRFRSLVSIAASVVASLLVFSTLSFIDSMDKMVSFSFDKVQHQDFILSLRDPLGINIMDTVKILPGVKLTESQLDIPVELKNGPYTKRINITGLPQGNRFIYSNR